MYISNCIFRPESGKQVEVIEDSKKVAAFWEQYGAKECHLFNLQGANVGCVSFIVTIGNA